MCCRVTVDIVPDGAEEYLRIAGFTPRSDYLEAVGLAPTAEHRGLWFRLIDGEKTTVRARFTGAGSLELSLYPTVTSHAGHADKRLGASVMFQTAALLAEKCGASVSQHATVESCSEGRGSVVGIAAYPDRPLLFENVCRGFREVLLPPGEQPADERPLVA